MHQFHKFILAWNSTCFGQFFCPSSGVYSLYTQQWYMSYSFRAGPGWNCSKAVYELVGHTPLQSVQWINSWWWTDELSETCRVSLQNKFVKLGNLVGFIIKEMCYGARSHERKNKITFLFVTDSWPHHQTSWGTNVTRQTITRNSPCLHSWYKILLRPKL